MLPGSFYNSIQPGAGALLQAHRGIIVYINDLQVADCGARLIPVKKRLGKSCNERGQKQHAKCQQPLVPDFAGAAGTKLDSAEEAGMWKKDGFVPPQVKEVNKQRNGECYARSKKGRMEETHSYEDTERKD